VVKSMGFSRVVCGLVLAGMVAASPAGAAPKGSADLQWAQQLLKDKHFDPGKPNGEMTAKTRTALTAYQRSVGLPATGDLDAATTARLMAEKSASPAMGTLGGTGGGGSSGAPQSSHAPSAPPALHAAPSSRVDLPGGPAAVTPMFGAGRGEAPAPQAVPSGTVTAVPSPALPGQTLDARGDDSGEPLVIAVAPWVRMLVVGVIMAILGGFAFLWWLSGRNPSWMRRRPLTGAATAVRVEPSFGGPGEGRDGGGGLRARRPL